MAEKKKSAPALLAPLQAMFGGHGKRLLAAVTLLVLLGVGLTQAWNRWGKPATAGDDYVVTPAKISITPQPAWIHADVKAEVVRDGSLSRLDLRDRKLLETVSQAFAMHSWVAKVRQVRKRFPAHVTVELEYRKPVAMVEVELRGRPGLLFIDASSILLPSEDFAANQTKDYLRVSAGNAAPAGVYGTLWGSDKIAGAARLAAAWGDRWKPLGLYRIVITSDPNAQPVYELHTKTGTRVVWGRAPGAEVSPGPSNEPSPEQKISHLLQLAAESGSLDKHAAAHGSAPIDLRQVAALPPLRRTAAGDAASQR